MSCTCRTLSVFCLLLVFLLMPAIPGLGQKFDPPDALKPDAATLKSIQEKTAKLGEAIQNLRQKKDPFIDSWLPDVEVFHRGAQMTVKHGEWFQKTFPALTLEVLDRGLERAGQLAQNKAPWLDVIGKAVARGQRSQVDDSVQPYAVTFPADYGKDPTKKWRLDVILHGRDSSFTEVKFLSQYKGDKPAPADQDAVHLHISGRGNNAYRWAGETDVFEALNHLRRTEAKLGRMLLDPAKVVLRGFSMGGAGTWHLGLQHPDKWCVIGPGAGFTTTRGYIKNLPDKLPDYQEACLHIYDAVDYAENAFNVPVVAYSGEKDGQKLAADLMEDRIRKLGIPMTHLIAPGLEHKFPPEWFKKADEFYSQHATRGRQEYPARVRFVTWTLQYPIADWVLITGLDRHYSPTRVDAERTANGFKIQTKNVRGLQLTLPEGTKAEQQVQIDGHELRIKPRQEQPRPDLNLSLITLNKQEGAWRSEAPGNVLDREKDILVHGPIDHAFMSRFICVRGTGKPWNPAVQKYAEADLKRFQKEWSKYMRGDLIVADDRDLSPEQIKGANLILFGDPGSNTVIQQVLNGLPITWTRETLEVGTTKESSVDHVPVLVYPNPLNPSRYVVINSGHTFHEPDFKGTNALLYPRLGDYALLKLAPTSANPLVVEVAAAGLFDEFWQLPKK